MRDLWLSVHPRWASAILSGSKTVELRRRAPQLEPRSRALVYATTPVKAVLGYSVVQQIVSLPLDELWRVHGSGSGVSKGEFDRYFSGLESGVGIVLGEAAWLDRAVPLSELRDRGELPAQGWRYLRRRSMDQLILAGVGD